jgi:hypothetical protein
MFFLDCENYIMVVQTWPVLMKIDYPLNFSDKEISLRNNFHLTMLLYSDFFFNLYVLMHFFAMNKLKRS